MNNEIHRHPTLLGSYASPVEEAASLRIPMPLQGSQNRLKSLALSISPSYMRVSRFPEEETVRHTSPRLSHIFSLATVAPPLLLPPIVHSEFRIEDLRHHHCKVSLSSAIPHPAICAHRAPNPLQTSASKFSTHASPTHHARKQWPRNRETGP